MDYQNLRKINYFKDLYIDKQNIKKYRKLQRGNQYREIDETSSTKSVYVGGAQGYHDDPFAKF